MNDNSSTFSLPVSLTQCHTRKRCEIQGCKEFALVLMIITGLPLTLSSLGQFDLMFMFWEWLHLS